MKDAAIYTKICAQKYEYNIKILTISYLSRVLLPNWRVADQFISISHLNLSNNNLSPSTLYTESRK